MMDHFKEDIVSPRAKALSNVLYVLCWVFIVLFGGYALMMLQVLMLQFSVTALITPPIVSGRVTVKNARAGRAPRSRAASTACQSMLSSAVKHGRIANGIMV